MRKSKIIKFNGQELTVKELTVSQVKDVLRSLDTFEPHTLDILMDQPVTASAVCMASGISVEDLEGDLAPSEIQELYDAVLEVNPTFAAMLGRLQKIGMEKMG